MASIAAQARREVNRMYRPASRSLNRQERKIKSLDKKHARDERAYQAWLRDTNAALNAEAAQRDSALAGQEQQYNQQLQRNLGAADQMAGNIGASLGYAGGQATPGSQDANYARARTAEMSGPGRTPLLDSVAMAQSARFGSSFTGSQRRGLELSQSVEKNTYAQVAMLKAQRRAATLEALGELAKQRGDLQMQKAAAVAQRTAEMEAAAAEAAQRAFENDLAIQKMQQEAMQFQTQAELDAARLDLDTWEARSQARDRRAQRRLDRLGLKSGGRGGSGGGSKYTPLQRETGRKVFDSNTELASRYVARVRGERKKNYGGGKGVVKGDVNKLTNWLMKTQRGKPVEQRLSRSANRVAAKRALGLKITKADYASLRNSGVRVA